MANNKIKEGSKIWDVINYIIAGILCIITIYPMYYVLILSVSEPSQIIRGGNYFFPKGSWNFDSYKIIVDDFNMWRAYANTILYVVLTTVLMLVTCILSAYPLTVKSLAGRKFVTIFILIPMYFSGGLIPTYLLMTKLHLYNNIWAVILPSCVSIWNIVLTRTFFHSIPETIRESACIDGANHFTILSKIYIPLAKPILAVIAIYTIVYTWNSWFNAMIYLPDLKLQPLQLYLRRVLVENTVDLTKLPMRDIEEAVRKSLTSVQLKYAMIIFTTLPVLFTYPFFQKYFIKGMMVGSLKG